MQHESHIGIAATQRGGGGGGGGGESQRPCVLRVTPRPTEWLLCEYC